MGERISTGNWGGGGGGDLREERQKISGKKRGKGRNDLNRERGAGGQRGGKILARKREKISGGERF